MEFIVNLIKTYIGVIFVMVVGYLINVYRVMNFVDGVDWNGWMLLDYFGMFVPPLGSLLGLLSIFGVGS